MAAKPKADKTGAKPSKKNAASKPGTVVTTPKAPRGASKRASKTGGKTNAAPKTTGRPAKPKTGGKKKTGKQDLTWWYSMNLAARRKYLKENPGSELKAKLRVKLPGKGKPGAAPAAGGKKAAGKDKSAALKARLAARLKKHAEKVASVSAVLKQAKTIRAKRTALAIENAKARANVAVTNLMNKTKARLKYLKATKPELKDGKIVVPKVPKPTFKKVVAKTKKVKGVNAKKTSEKRPASAKQKQAAKAAGKAKARNKGKATTAKA